MDKPKKFTVTHQADGRIAIRDGETLVRYWSPALYDLAHFSYKESTYVIVAKPEFAILRCREDESVSDAVDRFRTREVEVIE